MAGEGLGFHYEVERKNEICPDAWCDDCHAEAAPSLVAVCARCYEVIRARNWTQDQEAFDALVTWAVSYLDTQQEILRRDFKLSDGQPCEWNQDEGRLILFTDGIVTAMFDVVFAGSTRSVGNTWTWSWTDESMLELRDFGEAQGFEKIAGARWDGGPDDAWRNTAIAAKFLGGIGAHRVPNATGYDYLVITGVR